MNFLYAIFGIRKAILIIQNLIVNLIYSKRLGNPIKVFGYPILNFSKGSRVFVGKHLVLISAPYFSEPGVNHPVIIRTINSKAVIKIGDNVGISGGGIVAAKEVVVGNNVLMGANVFVSDTDFHPKSLLNRRYSKENIEVAPVIIGDNVFLGMNSVVLKGVCIGENSIIGANSVVTKSIPNNCVAAGHPAKIIKALSDIGKN